jgi:hypothetical protein
MPNRKNSLNKKHKPLAHQGRPAKVRLRTKPVAPPTPQSNVQDAAAAAPVSSSPQVSFFITHAQKAQLRDRGYTDEEIAQMKPAQAHKILGVE